MRKLGTAGQNALAASISKPIFHVQASSSCDWPKRRRLSACAVQVSFNSESCAQHHESMSQSCLLGNCLQLLAVTWQASQFQFSKQAVSLAAEVEEGTDVQELKVDKAPTLTTAIHKH